MLKKIIKIFDILGFYKKLRFKIDLWQSILEAIIEYKENGGENNNFFYLRALLDEDCCFYIECDFDINHKMRCCYVKNNYNKQMVKKLFELDSTEIARIVKYNYKIIYEELSEKEKEFKKMKLNHEK